MGTAPDGTETLLEREARRLAAVAEELAAETAKTAAAAPEAEAVKADPLLGFGSSITGLLKPVLQAQAKFAAGDYDQAGVRAALEAESKSAPVVVYTLSQSPFSIAAKRAELGAMTGRTSMPHVFINGQSIGGVYDG